MHGFYGRYVQRGQQLCPACRSTNGLSPAEGLGFVAEPLRKLGATHFTGAVDVDAAGDTTQGHSRETDGAYQDSGL